MMKPSTYIFLLLLVMVWWTVDIHNLDQTKDEKALSEKEALSELKALSEIKALSELKALSDKKPPLAISVLSKIMLPPAPTAKNVNMQANIQTLPSPQEESSQQAEVDKADAFSAKSEASELEVESILSELEELDGKRLQLYFPRSQFERDKLIRHLYQCEGIAFASIDSAQHDSLTILKNSKKYKQTDGLHHFSTWLRLVNHGLTKEEQNLLLAYTKNGKGVRLFPRTLDHRLALLLKQNLKAQALNDFTAQYSLSPQGLALTNIKVNNQVIEKNWLLSKNQCV